jgi:hypothetical protein
VIAGLTACLCVVGVNNLGRQARGRARAEFLWQALHTVERLPADAQVAWLGRSDFDTVARELPCGEGYHFGWHLKARGRSAADFRIVNSADGAALDDALRTTGPNRFLLTAVPSPVQDRGWVVVREFRADYWAGRKQFTCYLMQPAAEVAQR